MALDGKTNGSPSRGSDFKGRHLLIGTNVAIAVVAAVGICALLQWGAFYTHAFADLTDQGVNSLAPGTERLIGDLDKKIHLTAMYFQTDLEQEDQAKYRQRIKDLLNLYQGVNRSMVEIDAFNPLQDHSKQDRFIEHLRGLERFKNESAKHRAYLEHFQGEIANKLASLLQTELESVTRIVNGEVSEQEKGNFQRVEMLIQDWQGNLSDTSRAIGDALNGPDPRFASVVNEVATTCRGMADALNAVKKFAGKLLSSGQDVSADARAFLDGAEDRYEGTIEELEAQAKEGQALPPLELENILRQLAPTSNALVVSSDKDAKVIPFSDVWPPVDPNIAASTARFKDRLFKGEEKITSTVMQLVSDKSTGVLFIRYMGQPLFLGGFPGQPTQARFSKLRDALEDLNFKVKEWDISSDDDAPTFDPAPDRVLYVVLRPDSPQQNPFAQQRQPTFDESHRQKVFAQLGDNPRAVFLAGWAPGPFGVMASPYEYDDYLKNTWGIHVDTDHLVVRAFPSEVPGKWEMNNSSFACTDFTRSDHLLVTGMKGMRTVLPFVAPLDIQKELPDGVAVSPLLTLEAQEDLWGVGNIQQYIDQLRRGEKISRATEDVLGPFTVAAAAEKGDGKIMVISSRVALDDQVAGSQQMVLTSRGLSIRDSNPGNMHLFLNAMQWLNDRTEWMDVGTPVNVGTINVAQGPNLTVVKAFAAGVWPALALACGLVAWWVRRR